VGPGGVKVPGKRIINQAAFLGALMLGACTSAEEGSVQSELLVAEVHQPAKHFRVEAVVHGDQDDSGYLPAIAAAVRAGRARLTDEAEIATATVHVRRREDGEQDPRGASPLADLDFDGPELAGLSRASSDVAIFNSARKARARPDGGGDLIIKAECRAGDYALQSSKLCLDAEGQR